MPDCQPPEARSTPPVIRFEQHVAGTSLPDAATLGRGTCVAIGNFDGVHVGHQAELADATRHARSRSLPLLTLTFEPHPVTLFRELPPSRFRLTTPSEKISLLHEFGVDNVVALAFTREFASLTADAFVRDLLVSTLHVRAVFVGHDFNFGRARAGTHSTLEQAGRTHGFDVFSHAAVSLDSIPVSSTRIRDAVSRGAMREAARLLGRDYFFTGMAQPGAGRGNDARNR